MFILDGPYVSEFLKKSISDFDIPILDSAFARSLNLNKKVRLLDEVEFISAFKNGLNPMLYSNSENAIGWISEKLHFTSLPNHIDLFKDKVRFRVLLQPLFPDLFFKEVAINQLDSISIENYPMPFIIKPAVGFFSLGVYKVESAEAWPGIREKIKQEVRQIKTVYPVEVLDTGRFIIEDIIEGTEFAMDAYFNSEGEAFILSLFEHVFASSSDMGDRLYISSKSRFEKYLEPFTEFLQKIGDLTGLKNFPLHVELRINNSGQLIPIEINPLRTGGWCTTADMTALAFGCNPYEYIFLNKKPDWKNILKNKAGKIYSNIVLNNSSGISVDRIKTFDYNKLLRHFENPLELRQSDFKKFLIFGFLFAETQEENYQELEWALHNDFLEFITLEK